MPARLSTTPAITKPRGAAGGWIGTIRPPVTYAVPKSVKATSIPLAPRRSSNLGSARANGQSISLDHGNGYWTYYAHNGSLLVQAGAGVIQGQTIALSGSTGNSTGPHLDFRIRLHSDVFLDPMMLLP